MLFFSVVAIEDADFSSYKNSVLGIKRMLVEDERQMTFNFDQGYAFILNDLSFPIISKNYVTGDGYDPLVPVGTGPYQYKDYQQMQHLDLDAYKAWHGGDVYISSIQGVIINDPSDYETLFDQKLIDVMNPKKFNWLKYSEHDDQRIMSYTSSYYDFIGFNFDNPLFEDQDLRKAFAYGINREFLVYDRFVNHAILTDSPVIPNSWFASDSDITYKYDLEMAKSLIPNSLIDDDGDGFFDEADILDDSVYQTIELRLLVNGSQELRVTNSDFIIKNFEDLGFKIILDVASGSDYYEKVNSGDFDLLYGGWKLSGKPDYVALFDTFGSQNFINYSSDSMDQALEAIIDSYTDEKIIRSVSKFESIMVEELPYISLYFLEGAVMANDKVYGDFNATTESMFAGIEDIYLDFTE